MPYSVFVEEAKAFCRIIGIERVVRSVQSFGRFVDRAAALMARPAQPTTGMNPAAAMAPAAIRSASDSLRPVTGSTLWLLYFSCHLKLTLSYTPTSTIK
ncbi:hypothetical protein [Bacillus muralis]|uniref:hypothetical protein n=1 Tax=Peribacillus muralis TaxID=264697 RepID=UPI00070A024F